jgi:hypothetical protein
MVAMLESRAIGGLRSTGATYKSGSLVNQAPPHFRIPV